MMDNGLTRCGVTEAHIGLVPLRVIAEDQGRREFLLATCIALLLVVVLALRTDMLTSDHPDFSRPADRHVYIRMAKEPLFSVRYAAYCWRIATPLLARALPSDLQTSFFIIAFLSTWATAVTVYYLSKASGFQRGYALVGMLMFYSLGWATKSVLRDFWLPDALSYLLITLSIYFILVKKDVEFLAVLTLGVLVKETILFVAPLYYSLNTDRYVDRRLLLRSLLLILPALALFASIRLLIPSVNEFGYWENVLNYGIPRVLNFSLESLVAYTLGPFGAVVVVLALYSVRRLGTATLSRYLPFLVMAYSPVLIMDRYFPGNAQRELVVGFPAMIVLSVSGLRAVAERIHARPTDVLILPLHLLGSNLINPKSVSTRYLDQILTLILYVGLAAFIRTRKRPRQTPDRRPCQ